MASMLSFGLTSPIAASPKIGFGKKGGDLLFRKKNKKVVQEVV